MNPLNNWKFSLPLSLMLLSYSLFTPDWFAMVYGVLAYWLSILNFNKEIV